MRKITLIALGLILIIINYNIYNKEQIIDNGETVYVPLLPRDPRSIMQGDYMRLRYPQVEDSKKLNSFPYVYYAVATVDKNNIATKIEKHYGGKLFENQYRFKYKDARWRSTIMPDTYMFQEGHAKFYEPAKYGVFKFDGNKDYVLIGLAGEDLKIIEPIEESLNADIQ